LLEGVDLVLMTSSLHGVHLHRVVSRLHGIVSRLQLVCTVHVSDTSAFPVATVRDLGVYLDADVSTAVLHVTATVRACFAALRQIHSVR